MILQRVMQEKDNDIAKARNLLIIPSYRLKKSMNNAKLIRRKWKGGEGYRIYTLTDV